MPVGVVLGGTLASGGAGDADAVGAGVSVPVVLAGSAPRGEKPSEKDEPAGGSCVADAPGGVAACRAGGSMPGAVAEGRSPTGTTGTIGGAPPPVGREGSPVDGTAEASAGPLESGGTSET